MDHMLRALAPCLASTFCMTAAAQSVDVPRAPSQVTGVALAFKDRSLIMSNGRDPLKVVLNAPWPQEFGTPSLLLRSPLSGDVVEVGDLALPSPEGFDVDISPLYLIPGRYQLSVGRMEAGKRLVIDNADVAINATPDAPRTGQGFVFTPRAELGVKSQFGHRQTGIEQGGFSSGSRNRYADLTVQASFETQQGGDGWELKSRAQIAGSSVRQEAPTFGTRQSNAAKFDLLDYLVDLGYRDTRTQLGQISSTTHPVLHINVSNRGFSFAHRVPSGFEFTGSAQSSANLSGTSNLTGLSNRHAIHSNVGVGYDFQADKPGHFRADVMHFDGRALHLA